MSTCWQIESQSNSPTQRVRSDWGAPRVLPAFLLRQGTLSPPGFAGREGYLYIDKETSGFSLMTPPSALEGLS